MRIIRTANICLGVLLFTVSPVCAEPPDQTIEFLDQHSLEVQGMHRRSMLAAEFRTARQNVDGRRARSIRQFQYGFEEELMDNRYKIDRWSRLHGRLTGRLNSSFNP